VNKKTFERLAKNEAFNIFLNTKFNTLKKFGIEGTDSFVSSLEALIDHAANKFDYKHIVIGMAHRGRLNTLALVLGKKLE